VLSPSPASPQRHADTTRAGTTFSLAVSDRRCSTPSASDPAAYLPSRREMLLHPPIGLFGYPMLHQVRVLTHDGLHAVIE